MCEQSGPLRLLSPAPPTTASDKAVEKVLASSLGRVIAVPSVGMLDPQLPPWPLLPLPLLLYPPYCPLADQDGTSPLPGEGLCTGCWAA
jgi:hypothetical protein